MGLSPPSGSSGGPKLQPYPSSSTRTPSQGVSKASGNSEQKAREIEREAQFRAQRAQKYVSEAEAEARDRLDYIKDQYERKTLEEKERQDESYQKVQHEGYERLVALKRQQQQAIKRMRQQAEKELARIDDHFQRQIHETTHRGEQRLKEESSQQERASLHQKNKSEFELASNRLQHQSQVEQERTETKANLERLTTENEKKLTEMRKLYEMEGQKARKKFHDDYQRIVKEQTETLQQLLNQSSTKVEDIRLGTAEKLSGYSSRQSDPFYQFMDMAPRLAESGSAFTLSLAVPPHEESNVSIAVQNNQVVISGKRTTEESIETSPGRMKSSAAFQSFSEVIPLDWPVDHRLVSREYDGSTLTFTLPKKRSAEQYQPFKKGAQAAKIKRPDFPSNIPISKKTDHKPLG